MTSDQPTPGADWRVGLARTCITPEPPGWLYGYACKPRHRDFAGKLQDLYAKALAIEWHHCGARAVLITLDLCVLRARQAAALLDRVTDKTGLPPQRILVNLSHTHSGPLIGTPPASWYPMTEAERDRAAAYTEELIARVAEAAVAALADLAPARLSLGAGRVGFVRNRRLFDAQGKYRGMGPNPDLYTDPRVPVLRVEALDGALRALVFGLACHAVTLDAANIMLSGDYPGYAQQRLETGHPGLQAMFVQGCGADANSHPRGGPEQVAQARRHGEGLAAEVERVAAGPLVPVSGPLHTERAWAELPLRQLPRERLERMAGGPMWESHNAKRLLALLDRGEPLPTHYRAPLAVWQFGRDLTLVGISGEVVSGFAPLMEAALGPERLWVAGYCNQVFGYLPTARIVAEGGYETVGLVEDTGLFAAEAQDVVVVTVRRLAANAGRPIVEENPLPSARALLWSGRAPIGDGTDEAADVPMSVYLPAQEKATGAAVVICPGGGYIRHVLDREGPCIARWLTEHGIAGIVLEYRLPQGRPFVPLFDAQRAIRTVRSKAAQWNLDPNRIGIMGFSAGGHVASSAGTHFDDGDPKAADPIARLSCRPDFMVLVYPVITMGEKTNGGSRTNLLGPDPKPELVELFSNEKQVTDKTPPTFLAHAKDDTAVPPENSRMFVEALKSHNVPVSYLELPSGGHGLNGCKGPLWEEWKAKSLEWLAAQGVIPCGGGQANAHKTR